MHSRELRSSNLVPKAEKADFGVTVVDARGSFGERDDD